MYFLFFSFDGSQVDNLCYLLDLYKGAIVNNLYTVPCPAIVSATFVTSLATLCELLTNERHMLYIKYTMCIYT